MSRGAPEERPADPSPRGLRSYSVILAAEIGEPAAQMFHRIWYFCICTKSGRVIKRRRWIRNSYQQWQRDHFPHWSLSTVRRALKTLIDEELIRAANHNQEKHVKTQWYTVNRDDARLIEAGYVKPKGYVQNEHGVCSKRTGGYVQNEHRGVFKMSTSVHRDNIEDNQSRRSSSSTSSEEEDEQLQKSQTKSRARDEGRGNGNGASADSGPEENVSAEAEGDEVIPPPDPRDDLLTRVYDGRVPPAVDFLAASPMSVNLRHYLGPFQNDAMKRHFSQEEIRAMDKPGPPALEGKCVEFVDRVLRDHFHRQPGHGFREMAMRACRGGFLNRCGFKAFCEPGFIEPGLRGYVEL